MVGSSASRIDACVASARASATRARSPPDSDVTAARRQRLDPGGGERRGDRGAIVLGQRREGVGVGMPAERDHRGDVHRPMRDVSLRQIGDVACALARREAPRAGGRRARCGRRPAAAPASARISVVLPAPFGPSSTTNSPVRRSSEAPSTMSLRASRTDSVGRAQRRREAGGAVTTALRRPAAARRRSSPGRTARRSAR